MADNALGTASLILRANSTVLDQGLNQAQASVTTWSTKLNDNVSVMASGWAGALIAAFNSVTKKLGDTFAAIGDSAKQAQALGVATDFFMAIQKKTGKSAEEFGATMAKMLRTLGEARAGSQEAKDAFGRLGISMDTVKDAAPEEVFTQVAQKISEIKNPADQVIAAVGVFGKQGAELLPLFQKGASGISEAVEKAKQLGIALNDADAEKVRKANKAMGELKASIQGALNQAAVALAPIVEAVRKVFGGLLEIAMPIVQQVAEAFGPIAETVVGFIQKGVELAKPIIMGISDAFSIVVELVKPIIELIIAAIQVLIDIFSPLFDAIASLLPAFGWLKDFAVNFVILPIIKGFRLLIQVIAGVVTALSKMPLVGKAFKGAAEGLNKFVDKVKETEDKLANPAQKKAAEQAKPKRPAQSQSIDLALEINKAEEELKKQIATMGMSREELQLWELAQKGATDAQLKNVKALQEQRKQAEVALEVKKLTEELDKQIATMGMTADEVKRWELAQKGATDAQLAQVKTMQDVRKAFEDYQKLLEDGKKLTEELKTPQEKFSDEMTRLQKMLEGGAISWNVYERAASKALEDLAKQNAQMEIKTPQAMTAGSKEAVETIIKAQLAGSEDNSREAILQRMQAEQLEQQKIQTQIAQETLRVIRDQQKVTAI